MTDDKIGCDCDHEENDDAFWEDVHRDGGLKGEPMSQEYYDRALEDTRKWRELSASVKEGKEAKSGDPRKHRLAADASYTAFMIFPYKLRDTWVFDDSPTGLKEEAFVCGASEMISRLVSTNAIPRAEQGFAMIFSDQPFNGHDAVLSLLRPDEHEGNWYGGAVAGLAMECWLCPALFCYFPSAPEKIYVQADPLPAGVKPIWEPPDDAEPRRFVAAPE
jgi:hypothetical protein